MPRKKIGKYEIEHLQILDEEGKLDKTLEPKLKKEELLSLYRAMCYGRAADDRILKLQRQGRIGTCAPAMGQEGTVCGATFALGQKDWFVPSFRENAGVLMRGIPLHRILLYLNGCEEGNDPEKAERTLPTAVIVGAQTLQAVGVAYAMKYKKEKSAVLCFFGDGASSEGDFHEALNFAAVLQAPVVFLCVNNQWAISLPRVKQTRSKTIAQKALAYGIPGIQVDGNDPLAMYQATREALDRARAGKGPTLIEAVTYRIMMHTTADDAGKYRDEKEVEQWKKKDPIVRFRKYLEGKKLWDAKKEQTLQEELKAEIDKNVHTFESMKDFKPDASFDRVLSTRHEVIEEQRAEFLENLKLDQQEGKQAHA
jgi:pyruvate dehydrogenase E1 component alpha subunit